MQVLQEVERVLHQSQSITAKVMIVDDDPSLLQLLPPLLEPWGFKVSTLADSRLFWQTLVAVSPDLLILDIEMPHVGGMDLCQIVRNDAYWHNLPIIFLTAHTEAETVNQIFALGRMILSVNPLSAPNWWCGSSIVWSACSFLSSSGRWIPSPKPISGNPPLLAWTR